VDGRVQETVGAAGWPSLPAADGLSQRSLLGLLDSRPTPSITLRPLGLSTNAAPEMPAGPGACSIQPERRRDVKPKRSALTSNDSRRCWSTISKKVGSVLQTRSASQQPARFSRALRVETFEIVRSVVDVEHRRRDRAMTGALGDLAMHRLRDPAIARVTLR
jgi:hypothetical protein